MTKVIFLRVQDNTAKLQKIREMSQKHFLAKENMMIAVPSNEAAAYIDQLLWRLPEESFLPHAIVNGITEEKIALATSTQNVNKAKVILNLRNEAIENTDDFAVVYELLDLTHPDKERASRQRQAAYQAKNIPFEEN